MGCDTVLWQKFVRNTLEEQRFSRNDQAAAAEFFDEQHAL